MENQQPNVVEGTGKAILWTTPRMVSTAFAKCMGGIPDCEVWFEPYGYCNFAREEMGKAGTTDVPISSAGYEEPFQMAAERLGKILSCDFDIERLQYPNVKRKLEQSDWKYVFVKDQSSGMTDERLRMYLPAGFKHAFLIRNPFLVYNSLRKAGFKQLSAGNLLDESQNKEDTFDMRYYLADYYFEDAYQHHYNLWKYVKENIDPSTMVIDASDLLNHPGEVMSKYCQAMGFPYSESMLEWEASREVTATWKWPADTLYQNKAFMGVALESSKFNASAPIPPKDKLTPDVIALGEEAMPLYEEMYRNRLKVNVSA
ncbi:uncharacterized protein [Diadema setosum]|uniref:uncharacterized protein n=1 Tax=Diadema setosum TaxID=31175 RepID=UPI003B3B932E